MLIDMDIDNDNEFTADLPIKGTSFLLDQV
jgi:hypothetical protein